MSEPLSDIERRRMAIEQAKEARKQAHIAESQAKHAAALAESLETCGTEDALLAHIQRSIDLNAARAVLGDAAVPTASEDDPIPPPPTKGAA